jgi:hypothetical protein
VSVAVLSLLAEAAEDRPVLCLVDQAQWLDRSSAEVLGFAARRLEAEGVVLLFAARDGDAREFPAPGLPELRLGGLDPEAAAALLVGAGAELPPAEVDRLVERTGGNPLALLELPGTLEPDQLAGRAPLDDVLPLTTRLERAFGERVRRLPADARTLLLVAAAETTGDPAVVLRAGARLGVGAGALDRGESAGLVRTGDGRLQFRHPLVRSAAYRTATFAARQAAHRALADVLTGEDAADQRAWHLAAATVGPDEATAAELERSADRARRRDGHAAAAAALERVAALTGDDAERGRRAAAVPVTDKEGEFLSNLLQGMGLVAEGQRPAGEPLLRQAIALAGSIEHPRRLLWAGTAAFFVGDNEAGDALFARAVAMARRDGAVGLLPQALEYLAPVELAAGRLDAAEASAGEGLRPARETGNDTSACRHLATLAHLAALRGDEDACRRHAGEALDRAAARGLGAAGHPGRLRPCPAGPGARPARRGP